MKIARVFLPACRGNKAFVYHCVEYEGDTMPDIALRFHKDMLVLSAPIDTVLARQGVDVELDREFLSLIEPDVIRDAYYLEQVAGAQCLVTNTAGITRARLAHINMEDRDFELATASLTIMASLKPQHILAEIGPTGLPLDAASENSLKQSRMQYAQAAQAFGPEGFDAFFLNGMSRPHDMECALRGVRDKSDAPIFASLAIDEQHAGGVEELAQAFSMMEERGADVVGFSTAAPLDKVLALVKGCREQIKVPMLVQLEVNKVDPKQQYATEDNPYYCPDVMIDVAVQLREAGVQFLRATGAATPAYTGALSIASAGFDTTL